jgi:hypothetical protein
MFQNFDSHSFTLAKDWLLLGPMWHTIIAAAFSMCAVMLARIVMAAQGGNHGKIKGTMAKILNIAIIFHLLAVPIWTAYLFFAALNTSTKIREEITQSQRVRLPKDPTTGKVWFGKKSPADGKWYEIEIEASPNQQVLVHQVWETVHKMRTARFPNGVPETLLPSYNPSEDPKAKAKVLADPTSNSEIRKNPMNVLGR